MANNFWLNDAQWSATESHPPIVHTGPQRHDDRRVISGIFHRLREGCRWRAVLSDEMAAYDSLQPVQSMEQARALAEGFHCSLRVRRSTDIVMIDSSAIKAPSERSALLVILGLLPMVEAIPVFFAAGKCGIGLMIVMSISLAISTIATYVLLCVFSTVGLQRAQLGALERYGEVLSGEFIALIGVAFWVRPMMRTN